MNSNYIQLSFVFLEMTNEIINYDDSALLAVSVDQTKFRQVFKTRKTFEEGLTFASDRSEFFPYSQATLKNRKRLSAVGSDES